MDERPLAGDKCPVCGYTPLTDDMGIVVCYGCEREWDATGAVIEPDEDMEETE